MELLAPAGNMESFAAAVEAGADAVYVGAPGFNARNIGKALSLEEISGMIHYCRNNGRRLYLAANSLLRENELPQVIRTLAQLERLEPHGLIIQDLGLLQIIKKYFPALPVHASTLMAAHNADSVQTLYKLGCERVVLARELSLDEIEQIARNSQAELEVFIHGAMCYSYSGLCLFSSYFGGKSGLRGKCVQPCRRAYSCGSGSRYKAGKNNGGRKEYLFSMNDLSGLEAVRRLGGLGIASLKIEGRLRSAHYVSSVVRAYRMVIDADADELAGAMQEADGLIKGSMSRKTASGYFQKAEGLITPHHSGNIGLFLGKLELSRQSGDWYAVRLKAALNLGDRIRLHDGRSGERFSLTLNNLQINNRDVKGGRPGERAFLRLPAGKVPAGRIFDLYKVDSGSKGPGKHILKDIDLAAEKRHLAAILKKRGQELRRITGQVCPAGETDNSRKRAGKSGGGRMEIWLRIDSLKTLQGRLPFQPDRVVLNISEQIVGQVGLAKRLLGTRFKKAVWALPPIIQGRERLKIAKQLKILLRNGCRSFQIAHLSQYRLFAGKKVSLFGDYTLNLLNSQAVQTAAGLGLEAAQISVENDEKNIQQMLAGHKRNTSIKTGITVYGRPALYTSRLYAGHFQPGKTISSPQNEHFTLQKRAGLVQVFPAAPFSLLPYQRQLKNAGVDYGVIDLTGTKAGKKELLEIGERLAGRGKYKKLPAFNYLGGLD